MEQIRYTVILDITDNGCFNTGWRLKQGDGQNIVLNVKVTNNGDNYVAENPPRIVFKRPDGYSVIGQMDALDDDFYTYTIVGNEIAVAGNVVMDVKFGADNDRTSTASCKFEVIPDTIGQSSGGSDVYDNTVAELVEISKANVILAESYTKGGTGSRSGEDTDNAKYYKEQAAEIVGPLTQKVNGVIEDLTQFIDDGFLPKNIYQGGQGIGFFGSGGTAVVDNTRLYTDYIEIIPQTDITISIDISNKYDMALYNYAYYDANKTYLGDRNTNGDASLFGQKIHSTKIKDTNAKYIRVVCRAYSNADLNISTKSLVASEFQVEYGTSASKYTPYAKPNTELTQIVDDAIDGGYLQSGNLVKTEVDILVRTTDSQTQTTPKVIEGFNFELGKTYVISAKQSASVTSATRNRFQIQTAGASIVYEPTDCIGKTSHVWIYTPTENRPNSSLIIWGNTLSNEYRLTELMITEGTEAKPYKPYVPSNIELKEKLTQLSEITQKELSKGSNITSGNIYLTQIGKLCIITCINVKSSVNGSTALISESMPTPLSTRFASVLRTTNANDTATVFLPSATPNIPQINSINSNVAYIGELVYIAQ